MLPSAARRPPRLLQWTVDVFPCRRWPPWKVVRSNLCGLILLVRLFRIVPFARHRPQVGLDGSAAGSYSADSAIDFRLHPPRLASAVFLAWEKHNRYRKDRSIFAGTLGRAQLRTIGAVAIAPILLAEMSHRLGGAHAKRSANKRRELGSGRFRKTNTDLSSGRLYGIFACRGQ
jgi:hypothetical protein